VNYIKRCVAVGGQTIEIRNKQVFVDGVLQNLPAHGKFDVGGESLAGNPHTLDRRDNLQPTRVPAGHFFVMGDNRDRSSDSRFWGFVPRENVLGEAMVIHWSWAQDDNAPETSWRHPLSYVQSLGYNVVHFASRVRWGRLFDVIH
jgi:signal peptidase I